MNNRLEALKLAVGTVGNSNKIELAQEYLKFVEEGQTPSTVEPVSPVRPKDGKK